MLSPTVPRSYEGLPSSLSNDPEVKCILSAWFELPPSDWILGQDYDVDDMPDSIFPNAELASNNELNFWHASPESSLALVILLDAYPRLVFSYDGEAFGPNGKGAETADTAIARGFDQKVSVVQALAFYMPLVHQESMISLVAVKCLLEALRQRCVEEEEHQWLDKATGVLREHMQQLERFGRYPAWNAMLGRENTEEEKQFLSL